MQSKNMSPTSMSSMLRLQVIFVLGVVSESARNLQFLHEANVDLQIMNLQDLQSFYQPPQVIGTDDRFYAPDIVNLQGQNSISQVIGNVDSLNAPGIGNLQGFDIISQVIGKDDRFYAPDIVNLQGQNSISKVIGIDGRSWAPDINLSLPIENLLVNNNKNYFSNPDPANHYVFSIDTSGEKTLDAILAYQATPSVEDISRCGSYWKQQAEPEGYNGSQSTHCYPLSAVGRLQIQYPGISQLGSCTGTVIAPHTVLTAAHCFLMDPVNIEFIPGQFGNYKPFGSFKNGVVAKSDSFSIRTGASDYAIVTFSENIGKLTGWLGIASIKDCDKTKYDLTVVGYSEDKQQDRMWTSKCQNVIVDSCPTSQYQGLFAHECDTEDGTSGAPLIQNNIIIGLHSSYKSSIQKNQATHISKQIMRFIQTHLEMD